MDWEQQQQRWQLAEEIFPIIVQCVPPTSLEIKNAQFWILPKKNIQTESNFWKTQFEAGAFLRNISCENTGHISNQVR